MSHPVALELLTQLVRMHSHPNSLIAIRTLEDSRVFAMVARAWARAPSTDRVRVVVIWLPGKRRAFVVMDLRDALWLRAGL